MSPGSTKKPSAQEGFTLPELIVVLAGLGILSGLVVIPAVTDYLDYARVDEAKSLLNSVAADCLQGLRRKGDARLNDPINDDIISFTRLKNTGYVFKDGTDRSTDEDYLPNCSTVLITAAREDDRTESLPDLGFTLSIDGTLTKLAVNSGSKTKSTAESWAGKNTTEETELIEWQALNSAIIEAKTSCKEKRESFAKSPGIGRTKMWDAVKTSKCTTKPPKFEDAQTCTANGCTKDVYYLDGEICGYTQEAFNECRRKKTTAACQAEKDKKATEKATTQTIAGDQLPNCDEPVWFYEGEDVGSAEAWQPLMCERNKQRIEDFHEGRIEHCGNQEIYICKGKEFTNINDFKECKRNNKVNTCKERRDNLALASADGGPYVAGAPTDMQGVIPNECTDPFWICKKTIYETESAFKETPCGQKSSCSSFTDSQREYCAIPRRFNTPICIKLRECK